MSEVGGGERGPNIFSHKGNYLAFDDVASASAHPDWAPNCSATPDNSKLLLTTCIITFQVYVYVANTRH